MGIQIRLQHPQYNTEKQCPKQNHGPVSHAIRRKRVKCVSDTHTSHVQACLPLRVCMYRVDCPKSATTTTTTPGARKRVPSVHGRKSVCLAVGRAPRNGAGPSTGAKCSVRQPSLPCSGENHQRPSEATQHWMRTSTRIPTTAVEQVDSRPPSTPRYSRALAVVHVLLTLASPRSTLYRTASHRTGHRHVTSAPRPHAQHPTETRNHFTTYLISLAKIPRQPPHASPK